MPGSEDKELIKNVRVNKDMEGNILLSSVCQRLQEQGFNVSGMRVSYYCPSEEMYIFAGKDPIPIEKDAISITNLSKNRLTLKFRPGQDNNSPKMSQAPQMPQNMDNQPSAYRPQQNNFPPAPMNPIIQPQQTQPPPPVPAPQQQMPTPGIPPTPPMESEPQEKEAGLDQGNCEIWSTAKANRRTKERKISFVIEKVSMWRKLYNGIQDNTGKIVRYR